MPPILPLWTYTDFFLTPLHPNSQHLLSPFQGKPLVYWNSHAPRVYRKTQFILLGHYMHVWGIWYCFAIRLSNTMQVASSLTFFFFFLPCLWYIFMIVYWQGVSPSASSSFLQRVNICTNAGGSLAKWLLTTRLVLPPGKVPSSLSLDHSPTVSLLLWWVLPSTSPKLLVSILLRPAPWSLMALTAQARMCPAATCAQGMSCPPLF